MDRAKIINQNKQLISGLDKWGKEDQGITNDPSQSTQQHVCKMYSMYLNYFTTFLFYDYADKRTCQQVSHMDYYFLSNYL